MAGLFLFDLQKQSVENITTEDGLLSNACLLAFQDYSGKPVGGYAKRDCPHRHQLSDALHQPGNKYREVVTKHTPGRKAPTTPPRTASTFWRKTLHKACFLDGTEGPAYGMQNIAGKLYAGHHTGLFLLADGGAVKRIAHTHGLWQVKQLQSNPEFAIGGT